MKPKQIVIDKCAFQGCKEDRLCRFAQNHFLILPHLLYGEIVTNPDRHERKRLLRRFMKAMKAGAYWGSDVRHMIQQEGRTLQAYRFLPDLTETSRMRERFSQGDLFSEDHADDVEASYLDSADVFREDRAAGSQEFAQNILAEARERGRELGGRLGRFQFWIDCVDRLDGQTLRAIAMSAFGRFIETPDRFCLSAEWVTWQYIRLQTVLFFEYAFQGKGQGGKKEREKAEHDLHDLLYVVLLSRAEALLSADKGVYDLARAAFPEKDVFSRLEEVPDSYRCDWAEG